MSITIFIFLKIVCGWIGGNIEMNRDLPENKFLKIFIFGLIKRKKKNIILPLYITIRLVLI